MKSKSEKLYLDREIVPEYGNCDWFSFLFSFTHFLNLCLQLRLTGLSAHTALKNAVLSFYELSQQKRERKPRGGRRKNKQRHCLESVLRAKLTHLCAAPAVVETFPASPRMKEETRVREERKRVRSSSVRVLFAAVAESKPTHQLDSVSFFLSLSLPPSLSFLPPSLSTGTHSLWLSVRNN